MRTKPKVVLQQLKSQQLDPNSTAAREIIEEVAERVLRDLTPTHESQYLADLKTKSSQGDYFEGRKTIEARSSGD